MNTKSVSSSTNLDKHIETYSESVAGTQPLRAATARVGDVALSHAVTRENQSSAPFLTPWPQLMLPPMAPTLLFVWWLCVVGRA